MKKNKKINNNNNIFIACTIVFLSTVSFFSLILAGKTKPKEPPKPPVVSETSEYHKDGFAVTRGDYKKIEEQSSGEYDPAVDSSYIIDEEDDNEVENLNLKNVDPMDTSDVPDNYDIKISIDDGFPEDLMEKNLNEFLTLDEKIKKAFYACDFTIIFMRKKDHSNLGGFFDNNSKEITIYNVSDVPCLLHEIGHFVDWNIGIRDNGRASRPSKTDEWKFVLDSDPEAQEYIQLVYDFDSAYGNEQDRLFYSEGFAIYFEQYYRDRSALKENHAGIYDFMERIVEMF